MEIEIHWRQSWAVSILISEGGTQSSRTTALKFHSETQNLFFSGSGEIWFIWKLTAVKCERKWYGWLIFAWCVLQSLWSTKLGFWSRNTHCLIYWFAPEVNCSPPGDLPPYVRIHQKEVPGALSPVFLENDQESRVRIYDAEIWPGTGGVRRERVQWLTRATGRSQAPRGTLIRESRSDKKFCLCVSAACGVNLPEISGILEVVEAPDIAGIVWSCCGGGLRVWWLMTSTRSFTWSSTVHTASFCCFPTASISRCIPRCVLLGKTSLYTQPTQGSLTRWRTRKPTNNGLLTSFLGWQRPKGTWDPYCGVIPRSPTCWSGRSLEPVGTLCSMLSRQAANLGRIQDS